MRPPPRRPAHAAAGGAGGNDRRRADEFYGLYDQVRLMLVREFEDKGLRREDAVATAQAFLNRLMLALFVEGGRSAGTGGAGDGIARVLEGGIGAGTRRVWDYIVGDVFGASGEGRAQPSVGMLGGGLFGEPLDESAFFPDQRGREFFASPGARSASGRSALPEYRPRIAEAVRGAPGLNPAIGGILRLCSYDFQSQIGVDMLGRIFERSVTDLEALLGRRAVARKQRGIFYTPGYVADYICSRTIAGYLSLGGGARDPASLVAECADNLDDLEERMGRMSILDPACGSGAFLAGAVRTLIGIHEEIERYRNCDDAGRTDEPARSAATVGRVSRMLRTSIYGIDTSPQSVDIARLSLLLLAEAKDGPCEVAAEAEAAAGSGLPYLSDNIVVGNGVLAGPDRGGLDWARTFPAVFAGKNPGFSVIVGNPPYVRHELLESRAKRAMGALPDGLDVALPRRVSRVPMTSDLSVYFYYHSLARLRKNGRLGFISSDNWLRAEYGRPLRRALLAGSEIKALVSPRFKVFPDADVNTVIVLLARSLPATDSRVVFANVASYPDLAEDSLDVATQVPASRLGEDDWSRFFDGSPPEQPFPTVALGSAGRLRRGITTGCNDFFVLLRGSEWERRLPPSCLKPLVGGNMPPRLDVGRATRYIFDVGDSRDELARTSQGRLVMQYIKHGEATTMDPKKGGRSVPVPLPEIPTIAGRSPWYSLHTHPPPPIFIGRIIDRTIRVHENVDRGAGRRMPHMALDAWLGDGRAGRAGRGGGEPYLALDTHLHFTPFVEAHTGAFLAYFASSYFALDMEKSAAPLGGGGLRIDNRVLAKARVPAFDKLSSRAVRGMDEAWSEYCTTLDRKKLDMAVFISLGMVPQLDVIRSELDRLVARRLQASKRSCSGGT